MAKRDSRGLSAPESPAAPRLFRQPGLALVADRPAPRPVLVRDSRYRRLLALADLSAVAITLSTVFVFTDGRLLPRCLTILPLVVLTAKLSGLYDRDEAVMHKTTLEEAPSLFQLSTLMTLTATVLGGGLAAGRWATDDLLALWLGLFASLVIARTVARRAARQLTPTERCLFIGDLEAAARFGSHLANEPNADAEVAAQIELASLSAWTTLGSGPGNLDDLRHMVQELGIHRVVLDRRTSATTEVLDVIRALKAVGVRISLMPHLFEVVGSSVEFDDVHGMPLLGVHSFNLNRSSRVVKRTFDLVAATTGVIALTPLGLVVALAVKLTSRGPVFFRQERVGRGGRRFSIFKFRTMVQHAEQLKPRLAARNEGADGFFKIASDPRVTRVGRVLRRTNVDELPQLVNVLRGEMSLVGPRPLIPEEDRRVEGWHRRRLDLTPGITGPWQVLGSSRVPLGEMVTLDYLYLANWSLWNDIKLLLRTMPRVFRARGM
jgi:exopolysaccharide biosynthesis polyprenyl glycosylphosphotransferase